MSENAALNIYGDQRDLAKGGRFGVDVAMQRADDLDQLAIAFVKGRPGARALDAASAGGGQALRMALAGATTLALDIEDYSEPFMAEAEKAGVQDRVHFIQCDLLRYRVDREQSPFDAIVCQRMIHYLSYSAAVRVLISFRNALEPDGRLFISASGLFSELGNGYSEKEQPLESRYGPLGEDMATKHGIHGSVCLYSEADMAQLLTEAGLKVDKVFSSAFGNIKAVATR